MDRQNQQLTRFSNWTIATSVLLFAATWRLWTPHQHFPQVPFSRLLCSAPSWLDWALLFCLSLFLIGSLVVKARNLLFLAALSVLVGLVLLDQHRLQAWTYELILVLCVLLLAPARQAIQWLRILLISIYFYSAIGKFDFQFLHTVGQQILEALAGQLRIDISNWNLSTRNTLVLLFPIGEVIIACGLALPRTRRLAVWFAVAMHTTLMILLGPLGLNHRSGVLIWNFQVAGQVWLLFSSNASSDSRPVEKDELIPNPNKISAQISSGIAKSIIVFAIVMPIFERWGWYDHWPSWALYAPHSSRVRIEVAPHAIKKLPASLQQLIPSMPETGEVWLWQQIPIDQWSLENLDTPIYPQARYQLGVAVWLAQHVGGSDNIRAVEQPSASRFTGVRASRELRGLKELQARQSHYWLNIYPRQAKQPIKNPPDAPASEKN